MNRLPSASTADPEASELVAQVVAQRGQLGELYPLLLHSPGIARGMLALGNGVRRESILAPAVREIAICRVGILNDAHYEVLRHREIAEAIGVERDKLDGLVDWESRPEVFTPLERDVLAYADVMTRQVRVPDTVFARVSSHFSARELLELTVTIGYYNLVSRVLVALEIAQQPDERGS